MKKLLMCLLVYCCSAGVAAAVELSVAEGVITSGIEQQQPVDQLSSYPADYGKLFCFTRIVGASHETSVTHVWYFKDNEMARVDLTIGSANWRTYSSKRFLPQWSGDWRVVVVDAAGRELATIPFVLE